MGSAFASGLKRFTPSTDYVGPVTTSCCNSICAQQQYRTSKESLYLGSSGLGLHANNRELYVVSLRNIAPFGNVQVRARVRRTGMSRGGVCDIHLARQKFPKNLEKLQGLPGEVIVLVAYNCGYFRGVRFECMAFTARLLQGPHRQSSFSHSFPCILPSPQFTSFSSFSTPECSWPSTAYVYIFNVGQQPQKMVWGLQC